MMKKTFSGAVALLFFVCSLVPCVSCSSDDDGTGLSNDSNLVEFHLSSYSDSLYITDYAGGKLVKTWRIKGSEKTSIYLRHGEHQLDFYSYNGTGYSFRNHQAGMLSINAWPGRLFARSFNFQVLGEQAASVPVELHEITGEIYYIRPQDQRKIPFSTRTIRTSISGAITSLSITDNKFTTGTVNVEFDNTSYLEGTLTLLAPPLGDELAVSLTTTLLDKSGNVIDVWPNRSAILKRAEMTTVQD